MRTDKNGVLQDRNTKKANYHGEKGKREGEGRERQSGVNELPYGLLKRNRGV